MKYTNHNLGIRADGVVVHQLVVDGEKDGAVFLPLCLSAVG